MVMIKKNIDHFMFQNNKDVITNAFIIHKKKLVLRDQNL